ncbi:kinesin-like protein KIF18B isoform X1 [Pogoniulus pusillus]|uniref:kinesin-like protein KIF18B isoform X1 n=1 Tax=Pogoniulus pusillus TaxID=488313 RepID=UPI0030B9796C
MSAGGVAGGTFEAPAEEAAECALRTFEPGVVFLGVLQPVISRALLESLLCGAQGPCPEPAAVAAAAAMALVPPPGEGTVAVVVRVRPPAAGERAAQQPLLRVVDRNTLVFDPEGLGGASGPALPARGTKHPRKQQKFVFDRVFGEQARQEEVFQHTTRDMLGSVLDGYNCSVFAYGATGAGKTFTMLGSEQSPGIIYLTMVELYKRLEAMKEERSYEVLVSYLEVYNEQIHDLLEPKGPLSIREEPGRGAVVQGLSFHQPSSAEQLLQMLLSGNRNRTQHPTDANACSSRSHAVFQVCVKQQDCAAGLGGAVRVAKLSLVDLAGSERASVAKTRGERLREGASINRSLLALINVLTALAGGRGRSGHVPYRDSKLTRLLKDCLGGNCRTLMLAALSPSPLASEDTYSTLKYASQAKAIRVSLKSNLLSVDCHVCGYTELCEQLRAEVAELRAKLRAYEDAARASQSQVPVLLPAHSSGPSELPRAVAPAVSCPPQLQSLHEDGSFLAPEVASEEVQPQAQQEAAPRQEQVPAASTAAELSGASPAQRSQQGCDGQEPAESSVAVPGAPVISSPLPGWQHLAPLTSATLLALSPIKKRERSPEMPTSSQLASPCSLSPRVKRQRRCGQQAEAARAGQSLDSLCLPAAAPAPPGSLPASSCSSSLCPVTVTQSRVPLSQLAAQSGCALPQPSGPALNATHEVCRLPASASRPGPLGCSVLEAPAWEHSQSPLEKQDALSVPKAAAAIVSHNLNVTYEVCRVPASASSPEPLGCSVLEAPNSHSLLTKQDAPSVPKPSGRAGTTKAPCVPKLPLVCRASALKQKAEERAICPTLGGHRSRIPQLWSSRQRSAKASVCQPQSILQGL